MTLSRMQTISLLRDLLMNKQYRVEIWGQENRTSSNWKIKQRVRWRSRGPFPHCLLHHSRPTSLRADVAAGVPGQPARL